MLLINDAAMCNIQENTNIRICKRIFDYVQTENFTFDHTFSAYHVTSIYKRTNQNL
jgi:hypothetical protein